jgi:hypothetical protein
VPADIPTLVTSERIAAVDAINEDLKRTLTFLQGERIAALLQISEERIAAMKHLSEERVAILKEVREIAANERLALSQDIEQASYKVVDRAAWRLAQIVAATLVSVLLSALILLFIIRKLFVSPAEPHQLDSLGPVRAH